MNGIELQDREFFAAIREGREPNASVAQVCPATGCSTISRSAWGDLARRWRSGTLVASGSSIRSETGLFRKPEQTSGFYHLLREFRREESAIPADTEFRLAVKPRFDQGAGFLEASR